VIFLPPCLAAATSPGVGKNAFWLVVSTPLKTMKVSWDDDIPNIYMEKLHQHRPQTATTHVSTKVMCNSKFMELSGTLLLRKERRRETTTGTEPGNP